MREKYILNMYILVEKLPRRDRRLEVPFFFELSISLFLQFMYY